MYRLIRSDLVAISNQPHKLGTLVIMRADFLPYLSMIGPLSRQPIGIVMADILAEIGKIILIRNRLNWISHNFIVILKI